MPSVILKEESVMMKKILLLGSGELGKEFAIACQRLGQHVIAVDSYEGAPAMQVAHEYEVINMLDGNALDQMIDKHKPDIIVPEIEAIRTERFYDYEAQGFHVVPSARAANFTMNRKAIRDLANQELKIVTAKYAYAKNIEEFDLAVEKIGIPCVVKPLMSSSGKGQSLIKTKNEIQAAWQSAVEGGRGDVEEVIVEEFIDFEFEITLLTVTQKEGPTLFCAPIGHRQERGDYQESWQPMPMNPLLLEKAQAMAEAITLNLGGAGIWGVEFFVGKGQVWFSELSPRPHDTGMVTLAGTQNFNEFELHARAVLGLPIPEIELLRNGVSTVLLAQDHGVDPQYAGLEDVCKVNQTDVRIFGKPATRPYRRMGVVLAWDQLNTEMDGLRQKAKSCADLIQITSEK